MSLSTTIPVLGVDTGGWLSSRVDHLGQSRFYFGSATANQRLNLPGNELEFGRTNGTTEIIKVRLDTQMVSGLSEQDREARRLDQVYAMSRCSLVATVFGAEANASNEPIYCLGKHFSTPVVHKVRIRLEIESIYDLVIRWNRNASDGETALAKTLPIGSLDQIMVVDGDATSLLLLESKIETNVFEASVFSISSGVESYPCELVMPTLNGTARIGVIENSLSD